MMEGLFMKSRKIMMLLMIIALTFSLLTYGCAGNATTKTTGNPTSSSKASTQATVTSKYPEKLSFTWLALNDKGYPSKNGTWAQKIFEDEFNVSIKVFEVDCQNSEKMALFWAEGNKPDVIQWNFGNNNWMLVEQDIIRPISEEMMTKNMPNVMRINAQEMGGLDVGRSVLTYKGKYWGIPIKVYRENCWIAEVVRKDWLTNVGLNAPKTLDDYHEMLKRFTFNDPDKNGKNDTYGIHGAHWMQFAYIQSSFGGAYLNAWQYWKGEIINSSTTDRYKEMLKTLQQWYKEGIIDPEMITENRTIQREKWSNGKFGVICDAPSWLWSTEVNGPLAMLKNKNPKAEFMAISPITGPYGAYRMGGVGADLSQALWFGKNASDAVVERVMKAYEEISVNKNLYIKLKYGEEGKQYVFNNDGTIKNLLSSEGRQQLGMASVGLFCATSKDKDYWSYTVPKEDLVYYDVMDGYPTASFHAIGFITNGQNQAYLDKNTDINNIMREFYFNAIAGKVNVDAEWGNYLTKLDKAGINTVKKEFEKIFVLDPIK
jgi:putative aldouronate transport system substrate-binding protein